MTANTVDIRLLRSGYGSRNDFKTLFDYLAGRHKNSRETKTDRLLNIVGHGMKRSVAIEFFRLLESARCGKYIAGRRGHQSRFSWAVDLTSVGKAASGHADVVEDIPDDDVEASIEAPDLAGEVPSVRHRYHLRPDFEVNIDLPIDLTVIEANRLSEFVKTLPFSGPRTFENDLDVSRARERLSSAGGR